MAILFSIRCKHTGYFLAAGTTSFDTQGGVARVWGDRASALELPRTDIDALLRRSFARYELGDVEVIES